MSENKDLQEVENLENASKKESFFSRLKAKHTEKKTKKLEQLEKQKLSDEEHKKLEEKLDEVEKEVKEKSSGKKTKIKNICFFVLNIVLVAGILIWNLLSTEDFTKLNLADVKIEYVFVVLALLVATNVADIMSTHRMIYRKTVRSRLGLSYKSCANLRYYDAITPMSSGEPFMVTYLTKRDIPASTALSIPIAKLVFNHIAWLTTAFVCLVISFVSGMSKTFVSAASIMGFIFSFVLVATILFISLSKKVGKKTVAGVLKLLAKMKIIKNYEKQYEKVMRTVDDYQNIIKEYSTSFGDIIYQIVLHGIRIIGLYCTPYFIYLIFPYNGGPVGNFGDFFVFTALIDLASSFIPLPGGTGMNEITFSVLFADYLGGYTFWALLLWRFCSYYFYLLQGIGLIAYDTVYGNRKYRWIKTKYALQEESKEFRRLQIENFRQERNKRRKKEKLVNLNNN